MQKIKQPHIESSSNNLPSSLKAMALFMICLIIMLPVYTSNVYADSIEEQVQNEVEGDIVDVEATGLGGIPGYTSTDDDDFVDLVITLIYTLESLQKEQVRISFNNGPTLFPDDCVSDGGTGYICNLQTKYYNNKEGSVAYKITLTDPYLFTMDTFTGSIVVDGQKPIVNIIPTKKASEKKVYFNIAAEDTACASGCINKCSGLKEVIAYVKSDNAGDNTDNSAEDALDASNSSEEDSSVEDASGEDSSADTYSPFYTATEFDEKCEFNAKKVSKTYAELGITGGKVEFCVKATDNVGLENTKCKPMNLDVSAPVLGEIAAVKNGQPLGFIKKDETPSVDILLNVTDDSILTTSNAVADFSGLNPSISGYKEIHPGSVTTFEEQLGESDEETVTIYQFQWSSLTLNNPEGLTGKVKVSDSDGNSGESEFTLKLNVDGSVPEAGGIYTDMSLLYLNASKKNTIYADFLESGSGISKDTVFLNLKDITGEAKKAPANCTAGDGGIYTCMWYNILPKKMIGTAPNIDPITSLYYIKAKARFHPDSTDIAGNKILGDDPKLLEQDLILDDVAPEVISAKVSSASSQSMAVSGFTGSSSGDASDQAESQAEAAFTEAANSGSGSSGSSGVAGQAYKHKAGQIITNAPEEVIVIKAYLFEAGSVLDPNKVFAQLNVVENWPDPTPASSCDLISPELVEGIDAKYLEFPYLEYLYECIWEVPTVPVAGSNYKFNIWAVDAAGNVDDPFATESFMIYQFVEGVADFFEDEFELDAFDALGSDYVLNQNFLYMSTQTYLRVLVVINGYRKNSASFVHDFDVGECTVTKGEVFVEGDLKPVAIVSQTYLASSLAESREAKELLLAIPQIELSEQEQKDLKEGKLNDKLPEPLTIACKGEVRQSSLSGKKAYSPNEVIVFSVKVPLGKDIFSNPADSSLDKSIKYKKAIKNLGTIIKILKYVEYIAPYCKMINLVMQIWNNICMIYYGIGSAVAPAKVAAKECKVGSDLLSKLWYGKKGAQALETDPSDVGEVGSLKNQWNSKDMLSLGFICDLTLCTSCTETWNKKIGGDVLNIDTWTPDYLWNSIGFKSMSAKGAEGSTSGIDAINSVNSNKYSVDPAEYWAGTSQIRFPFDPHKNFWVALICWPPCIPTIIRTLEMVKRVLVAQNTCMNKAYLLGEDIEDCPNLGWRLFCILTFGQFMHVLPDMLRQYVTKTVSSLLSRAFELGCTAKNEAAAMYCTGVRIKHAIVGVLSVFDLITNIQQLSDEMGSAFDWGDSEDDDDSVDDEYSARAEEYGTLPSY